MAAILLRQLVVSRLISEFVCQGLQLDVKKIREKKGT